MPLPSDSGVQATWIAWVDKADVEKLSLKPIDKDASEMLAKLDSEDKIEQLRRQVEKVDASLENALKEKKYARDNNDDYWLGLSCEAERSCKASKEKVLKELVSLEVENLMKTATDKDSRLAEITKEVFR